MTDPKKCAHKGQVKVVSGRIVCGDCEIALVWVQVSQLKELVEAPTGLKGLTSSTLRACPAGTKG